MSDIDANMVAESFTCFLDTYEVFRKQNNLADTRGNVDRICNSMTDKHGRICRYVKHQERNDPKDDWPIGMTEAMAGFIVYMAMLLNAYEIDDEQIIYGFVNELNKAIAQHSK